MNTLNEKTEETVKKIHLMVTNLCTRNCPNCCNKCYSLNDIPVVTDDELIKEFADYCAGGELENVDGLSLSIKSEQDLKLWNNFVYHLVMYSSKCKKLLHNRLYCFIDGEVREADKFPLIHRKWVDYKEWKPADDSIFRRAF